MLCIRVAALRPKLSPETKNLHHERVAKVSPATVIARKTPVTSGYHWYLVRPIKQAGADSGFCQVSRLDGGIR